MSDLELTQHQSPPSAGFLLSGVRSSVTERQGIPCDARSVRLSAGLLKCAGLHSKGQRRFESAHTPRQSSPSRASADRRCKASLFEAPMRILSLATAALALSLCACMATYRYTRTEPQGVSCSLEIISPREVSGPISFTLSTCDATVTLGGLSGPLEQLGAQVVSATLPTLLQRLAPIPAPSAPVEPQQ